MYTSTDDCLVWASAAGSLLSTGFHQMMACHTVMVHGWEPTGYTMHSDTAVQASVFGARVCQANVC